MRNLLENIPPSVGHAIRGVRAGHDKLAAARFAAPAILTLTSSAFEDGAPIPARYTADGEGISPPLAWARMPAAAARLALVVEDPDAPSAEPFVHLIAWDIPPELGGFPAASFRSPGHDGMTRHLGMNSRREPAYLPPDPPPGQDHAYIFQLFALDAPLGLQEHPERGELLAAMADHVIAQGRLTGTYGRQGRA